MKYFFMSFFSLIIGILLGVEMAKDKRIFVKPENSFRIIEIPISSGPVTLEGAGLFRCECKRIEQ